MRGKLITILVVLVLLAAISAVEQVSVARITRSALEQTAQIHADIVAGNLNEAKEKAHALDEAWDGKAKYLEILVDHGSTDDVRYALSKLIAALEAGDAPSAQIYAGELEGGVEHVLERQALTLENLF